MVVGESLGWWGSCEINVRCKDKSKLLKLGILKSFELTLIHFILSRPCCEPGAGGGAGNGTEQWGRRSSVVWPDS
jgi:hypothetical protein